MANNRLRWDGLQELREALRMLPAELAGRASPIVLAHAQGAHDEIEANYPERTGNLKDHLVLAKQDIGRFGAGAVLKNTAKHAWIYENGTQARHNALGANRGSMPPAHNFIPRVQRWRRKMYEALKQLLVGHGLRVRGNF